MDAASARLVRSMNPLTAPRRARAAVASVLVPGILIATLLAGGCAGDLRAGQRAYEQGDYAAALEQFEPAAERGSIRAQYLLGVMHARGDGVAADPVEASKWYARAA